ncbi:MAG TPA: mechanosensitive ion channel domain-containing protein [Rhodanobacter sp.]|nr:mechanosensitive ion channel domain-containing protein [Rhodanobacter sp.]
MQATTAPAHAGSAKPAQAHTMIGRGADHVGDLLNQGFSLGGIQITIGSILAGLLLFVLFLLATVALKRLLHRYGERNQHVNPSSLYTVERLLHYLLLVVGLLWALDLIGIPIAKMTVFAGALGVGLGFGLQAIFNNFVSGLILLFDRSLKVGDFVELASGVHGHVREIRIRATLISTNDNIDILVPNSEFVTGRVVNWTLREVARRQRIPFRVPYGTDKELVKKAALEAAAAVPFTLAMDGPREPQVWLTGFGESSLDFSLVVWLNAVATRRVGRVLAAYNWALHTALEQHGIEIPFPQRDLHVRSWAARASDSGIDRAGKRGSDGTLDNDALRDVQREFDEAPGDHADSPSPPDPDAAR